MRSIALVAAGHANESERLARELIEVGRQSGDHASSRAPGRFSTAAILISGRPSDARTEAEAIRASLGSFADEDPDGIRLTAEVCRAQLMSGDHAAALELIEAMLPIAERLGLRAVMAELLPSWGWALAGAGRPIEAMAIMRGGLVFADREGLFNAEMRSRMNLSAFAVQESPAEALEVAWTASVRARQRGYIGWSRSAAGNTCTCARPLGEWDRIEAIGQELDALGDWASPWDFSVPAEIASVRAYRGRIAEARDLIERFELQFGTLADPQVELNLLQTKMTVALAEGDLGEAIRISRSIEQVVDQLGVDENFTEALAAASEGRDVVRVGEIAAALVRRGTAGRLRLAVKTAADAVGAVLDGDDSALLDLDRAADVFRAESVRFDLALLRRARALLAPDDPGAGAAAAEARAILEDLGARTLLRGLPAGQEPATSVEPDRSSTPSAADPNAAGVVPG